MKRLGSILFAGLLGYLAGGVAGYLLVIALSNNAHDRVLEAVMTGTFFVGPITGCVSALFAFFRVER